MKWGSDLPEIYNIQLPSDFLPTFMTIDVHFTM